MYVINKRGPNILFKEHESNKAHKNYLSLFFSALSNGSLCILEGKCTSPFFPSVYVYLLDSYTHPVIYIPESIWYLRADHVYQQDTMTVYGKFLW